jgi:hypothetical protein
VVIQKLRVKFDALMKTKGLLAHALLSRSLNLPVRGARILKSIA